MNLNKYVRALAVIVMSFLMPAAAMAQDPSCNPDLGDCPIDSGVVFLIIAAVGIAIKKYWDSPKKTVIV